MPDLAAARVKARAASSHGQLKQIGFALRLYSGDNKDSYPPGLEGLVPKYMPNQLLVDVLSGEKFVYLAAGRTGIEMSPDDYVAHSPPTQYGGNALFNDGHVQGFNAQEFGKVLSSLHNKTNQLPKSASEVSVQNRSP